MKKVNNEFIRFVLVGGINTMNYYLIYLVSFHFLTISYMISHWAAFLISMVISFFLNVYFTYYVKPTLKKFLQFPLTQIVNFSASSILMYVLVQWFGVSQYIAPIISVFFTVPITFLLTSKILKREKVVS